MSLESPRCDAAVSGNWVDDIIMLCVVSNPGGRVWRARLHRVVTHGQLRVGPRLHGKVRTLLRQLHRPTAPSGPQRLGRVLQTSDSWQRIPRAGIPASWPIGRLSPWRHWVMTAIQGGTDDVRGSLLNFKFFRKRPISLTVLCKTLICLVHINLKSVLFFNLLCVLICLLLIILSIRAKLLSKALWVSLAKGRCSDRDTAVT